MKTSQPHVLPHSQDAEKAVLGSILRDADLQLLNLVVDRLRPEHFFVDVHQKIYSSMLELYGVNQPTDLLTVADKLRRQSKGSDEVGPTYLVELMEAAPIVSNIEYYATIVADNYFLRQIISACQSVVLKAMSYDGGIKELVEEIEKEFISITNSHDRKGLVLAKDVLERTLVDLEHRLSNEGTLTGVPSGFKELDRLTGGWQKSDLILVGARPGMGKTAFALNCALNAARDGKGVAVFTLEMADTQLMMRLLSAEGRIDSSKLRKGDLDDEERDRLMLGARQLYKLNLGIDETPGITILELRSRCRRFKKERGLDLIIIDYLQLMRGSITKKYDSREHEISEVSRELKALAKELNVPIIALAQLNRGVEKRTDRTPQISDLRESGSIEQDADIILMLYRDEYYNKDTDSSGVALLKLAKNRHGSTDDVQLAFLPNFMKFADLYKGP